MSEGSNTGLAAQVEAIAKAARKASFEMAVLPTEKKNAILKRIGTMCLERKNAILEANRIDLGEGAKAGLSAPMLDRLKLDDKRIDQMVEGLHQVADLPDPVGEEIERMSPPRGLDIRKIRVPIGVIGIIYESRPNVTIDCAALCLKSGNAAILRGGKEAFHTNTALASVISDALVAEGVAPAAVSLIPTTDREALKALLKMDAYVHCIIPRGGEGLIRFVVENSRIPVIKHYQGVCSIYVDKDAEVTKAVAIICNAKCQRPGVCNAAENLFIHRSAVDMHLPVIAKRLLAEKVELRVDPSLTATFKDWGIPCKEATDEDFFTEFLGLVIAIKPVDSVADAIQMINHYGSGHSDAIITENRESAETFLRGVDSATVYWNASTRFTDGFEFGMGAEIGISTDRLHARGPMGLRELCSYKFLIYGKGEVR